MQLHERLMDLLGHEVSVTARADDAVKEIAAGSLKEVGPDYLIVGTTRGNKLAEAKRGKQRTLLIGGSGRPRWWR